MVYLQTNGRFPMALYQLRVCQTRSFFSFYGSVFPSSDVFAEHPITVHYLHQADSMPL